jgi:hypothetical protein
MRASSPSKTAPDLVSVLIDESGRIVAIGNALSTEANPRRLSDNETLALLLAGATSTGNPVAAELDAAARSFPAGERIGEVVAAFLDNVRALIRQAIYPRELLGDARPECEAPSSEGAAAAARAIEPDPNQPGRFECAPVLGTAQWPALLIGSPAGPSVILASFRQMWDGRLNDDEGLCQLRAQLMHEGQRTGLEHLTAID